MKEVVEDMYDYLNTDRYSHAGYMKIALRPDRLKRRLKTIKSALRKHKFDSIAFTGHSGSLLAAPIALYLNKELIMVRKLRKDSHSKIPVEGYKASKRYIIIDDLVSSGSTVKNVYKKVKKFAPKAVCLGVFEVNDVELDSDPKDLNLRSI